MIINTASKSAFKTKIFISNCTFYKLSVIFEIEFCCRRSQNIRYYCAERFSELKQLNK
jgi:hypothetical protein